MTSSMNLILIYGPPAAGKLTVANELNQIINYTVLDNHKVIDYLPVLFPRSKPEFEDVRMRLGRKIRLNVFEAAAESGLNLITTFAPISEGRHDFVRDIIQSVERYGGNVCLVQLLPSAQALEMRVTDETRRGRKADTLERLHELIEAHPAMFETFPDREHLVIDNTDMSPSEVARTITDHYNL
jgi:tRNA uridine 5-carbamoylmethylation protein Kti12